MKNPNFIRFTTGNGKKFNLYPTYINGRTPNEEDMETLKREHTFTLKGHIKLIKSQSEEIRGLRLNVHQLKEKISEWERGLYTSIQTADYIKSLENKLEACNKRVQSVHKYAADIIDGKDREIEELLTTKQPELIHQPECLASNRITWALLGVLITSLIWCAAKIDQLQHLLNQ